MKQNAEMPMFDHISISIEMHANDMKKNICALVIHIISIELTMRIMHLLCSVMNKKHVCVIRQCWRKAMRKRMNAQKMLARAGWTSSTFCVEGCSPSKSNFIRSNWNRAIFEYFNAYSLLHAYTLTKFYTTV